MLTATARRTRHHLRRVEEASHLWHHHLMRRWVLMLAARTRRRIHHLRCWVARWRHELAASRMITLRIRVLSTACLTETRRRRTWRHHVASAAWSVVLLVKFAAL